MNAGKANQLTTATYYCHVLKPAHLSPALFVLLQLQEQQRRASFMEPGDIRERTVKKYEKYLKQFILRCSTVVSCQW